MPLSRRRPRPAPLPTTGRADDDRLLRMLAGMVADLEAPRDWRHFVFCDADAVDALAARLRLEGWVTEPFVEESGVMASREDLAVTPETVPAVRSFFEQVAAETLGGVYDGREAAAV